MAIPWAGDRGIHWVGQKVHSGFIPSLKNQNRLFGQPNIMTSVCFWGKVGKSVTCVYKHTKENRKIQTLCCDKKMKCQMMTHTFSLITLWVTQLKVYHMLSLIWITNPKNQQKIFFFQICSLGLTFLRKKVCSVCVCVCVCIKYKT